MVLPPGSAALPPATAAPRWLSTALTLALAALCLAWELGLAPTGRGTLAVKALPLLIALPGLAGARVHTYRWMSLALWAYVAEGLVRGTSEAGLSARLALAEVGLSLLLFAALVWFIKARQAGRAALG